MWTNFEQPTWQGPMCPRQETLWVKCQIIMVDMLFFKIIYNFSYSSKWSFYTIIYGCETTNVRNVALYFLLYNRYVILAKIIGITLKWGESKKYYNQIAPKFELQDSTLYLIFLFFIFTKFHIKLNIFVTSQIIHKANLYH